VTIDVCILLGEGEWYTLVDNNLLTCTEPDRVLDEPTFDFGMESRHTLIIEGDLPAHEDVEDNAEAPDVHFWAGVDLCIEEFRCSKVERTAER
jgi:hypothetical protein